jgi:L-amino acid N-acyltransferase YncA
MLILSMKTSAGIGRCLVEHLLRRAPQCGITTVLAICFESNSRSCRLFGKLGFERYALVQLRMVS